ncbi:MAG: NADH-quinone oxidoreductase subunit L, partial [Alphaproteobacteria bacterium]
MAPPSTIPSNVLPLALALPFATAAVVGLLGRRLGSAAGWLVTAAAAASWLLLFGLPGHDAASSFRIPWLPEIGVEFALRADPFGRFFALLVSGVGFFVALYAIGYMADDDERRMPRFWGALATFMGAMLGIALSDDMLLLFLFWEITSLSSFLLIGHHDDEPQARAGALLALQVTALGGLVLAVGVLLVAQVTGTFSMSAIGGDPEKVRTLLASPLAPVALGCILVGVFTKSAQFPFHFWLPRAMVAPTPVSAYLHAATMVKAGPFLLGRMLPVFGRLPMWTPVLATIGLVTMLLGAWKAFRETDLKAILARTTGSTLGFLTLLYGFDAAKQDALQMLNHALYKGALFLVAGIVDHHVHTRDLRRLGGLRRELPLPFLAAVLAGLSMAGVPPLLGFLVKESFYEELLHSDAVAGFPAGRGLVVLACVAANVFVAAVAAKFVIGTFLGERRESRGHGDGHAATHADERHAPAPPLWISPLALALGALALGLLGATDVTAHLAEAIASRRARPFHVSLVPTLGMPLWLSLGGMAA